MTEESGQQPQQGDQQNVTEAFTKAEMGKRAATSDVSDAQAFAASPQRVTGSPDVTPAGPAGGEGSGGGTPASSGGDTGGSE